MESLEKKLNAIKSGLGQFKASLSMPKMSTPKASQSQPKMPGVAPQTQKDPVKMAEQLQGESKKDKNQVMDQANKIKEAMSVSKLGQWSIKSK